MNIYQKTLSLVEDCGAKFRVDFKERSLKVDGEYVIKNGEFTEDLGIETLDTKGFISGLEELYQIYKHSVPSERNSGKQKRYFSALPEEKLDNDDMMYGTPREVAQFELEMFVLAHILGGFEWVEEEMGKWFWQSKNDRDLVLLREWF